MIVADLMTKTPFCCESTATTAQAAKLMWEHDCGSVVVVDTAKKPLAVVTDRDICMAAYTQGLPLSAIAVSSAASKTIQTLRFDDALEHAEARMRQWQLRRLPVVDASGVLIGVLSLNDLARQARKSGVSKSNGLTAVGIAMTLAAVCEPRA